MGAKNIEKFDIQQAFAITQDTELYHHNFTHQLLELIDYPRLRLEDRQFPNKMPLYLVGSAKHVLYLEWLNGDNWRKSITNAQFAGNALKLNPDAAGSNTRRLGFFYPFIDLRQDQRSRKSVPDSLLKAIVKSQGIFVEPWAEGMKHVAKANYVVFFDGHNYLTIKTLGNIGLDAINITSAPLFAKEIIDRRLIDDKLQNVVVTCDAGDLNRGIPFQQQLQKAHPTEIAVLLKNKIMDPDGTHSHVTSSTLIHGSVEGKRVIVLDDIIDSGGTGLETVNQATIHGAAEIIYCATHPVFTEGYYKNLRLMLENPKVKAIMTTDSLPIIDRQPSIDIPYIGSGETRKEVIIVPAAAYLADAINIILSTSRTKKAIELLGDKCWQIQNPYKLAHEVIHQNLPEPQDGFIYIRDGVIEPL